MLAYAAPPACEGPRLGSLLSVICKLGSSENRLAIVLCDLRWRGDSNLCRLQDTILRQCTASFRHREACRCYTHLASASHQRERQSYHRYPPSWLLQFIQVWCNPSGRYVRDVKAVASLLTLMQRHRRWSPAAAENDKDLLTAIEDQEKGKQVHTLALKITCHKVSQQTA